MGTKTEASFWEFKGTVEEVDKWFMMGSPYICLSILVSYWFFVLKCGPKFMEKRPAYKLTNFLLIYNVIQVALSCYLFKLGLGLLVNHGLIENGICAMNDEKIKSAIINAQYFYYMAKLTELLDTVLFVLRKKWNQVTFLHVYHHSITFLMTWITLKYEPTYTLAFLGTINSFVHIIMYGYYGMSAFPSLQPYLWWKKYITRLQLIQFMLILIQVTWNYKVTTCPTSYFLIGLLWSHMILFMYLFSSFYFQSYKKTKDAQNVGQIKEKRRDSLSALKCMIDRNGNYESKSKKIA